MKRSEVNSLVLAAQSAFRANHWYLPSRPRWDVTDFGLGDWRRHGLVLVNLAEEPEYCEKLMFALAGMSTPMHAHHKKKEDIICRNGELSVCVNDLGEPERARLQLKINGEVVLWSSGDVFNLRSGERITLCAGIFHEFVPLSDSCIIGEVSTFNDDVTDNVFVNEKVGRYSRIEEDEPAIVRLVSDP